MQLTQEQIDHIAQLCRLSFSPQKKQQMQTQLSGITGYVDTLAEIDDARLATVDPIGDVPLRLRPDTILKKDAEPHELLACTPQKVIGNQIAIDSIM